LTREGKRKKGTSWSGFVEKKAGRNRIRKEAKCGKNGKIFNTYNLGEGQLKKRERNPSTKKKNLILVPRGGEGDML